MLIKISIHKEIASFHGVQSFQWLNSEWFWNRKLEILLERPTCVFHGRMFLRKSKPRVCFFFQIHPDLSGGWYRRQSVHIAERFPDCCVSETCHRGWRWEQSINKYNIMRLLRCWASLSDCKTILVAEKVCWSVLGTPLVHDAWSGNAIVI